MVSFAYKSCNLYASHMIEVYHCQEGDCMIRSLIHIHFNNIDVDVTRNTQLPGALVY